MILFKSCPICNNNNLSGYALDVKRNGPHISRVICNNCSIVFANPMADEKELEVFYNNYYEKGNFKLFEYKNKLSLLLKNKTQDYNLKKGDFIYKFINKGNILDIGAGIGSVLHLVDSPGFNLYATELDQDAINFVHNQFRNNVQIFKGDLINARYPDNFFDYIIFNHVIEHTLNPVQYLKEINRILKNNAILYIGTPDIGSNIYKFYRFLMFTSLQIPNIVDGIEHTFLFSKKTLKSLVQSTGFKIITHKNVSLNESFFELIKLKLGLKKLIIRQMQNIIPINQELICQKST